MDQLKQPLRSDELAQCTEHTEDGGLSLLESTRDTEGGGFSAKAEALVMWLQAWPMVVSFGARFAMASTDNIFVGHIQDGLHSPEDYLAAAALSDMVCGILTAPPLAFNRVLDALCGQALGANKPKMAGVWLQMSVVFVGLAYLPCLVGFWFVGDILHLLGFSPEICELAGRYALWSLFWPIPNGWYQCMRFYFQAQNITKPAMYVNVVFVGINALLNWIFVFGGPFKAWLGWDGLGFIGAAISLSISRCGQPLVYWLMMFVVKKAHLDTWPGWGFKEFTRSRVRDFLKYSLPQVGTLLFQSIIGQATTLMVAQLGDLSVAASSSVATATQLWSGAVAPTVNAVAGVRIGYYLGAGRPEAARRASNLVFRFVLLAALLGAAVLIPLRHQIISLVTSSDAVRGLAVQVVLPLVLSTACGLVVGVITNGVLGAQGRNTLQAWLSLGFELPASIGAVVLIVFVFKGDLVWVYWGGAAVNLLELLIVAVIYLWSDWGTYARQARERQEAEGGESEAGDGGVDEESRPGLRVGITL